MALHGSAVANLSPILFKGNRISPSVNVIIHQDQSGSMPAALGFFSNGVFIGTLQDQLLTKRIGTDIKNYPNLYAYFGSYTRNPSTSFTIQTLNVTQGFIKGEATGAATISNWIGTKYFSNQTTSFFSNICTNVIGQTSGVGRLSNSTGRYNASSFWESEDVHGNLWSIWTTPNAISTGTPGRFGSIIGSDIRKGSTTIIITDSDEQAAAPGPMINERVVIGETSTFFENYPGLAARRYIGYFGQSVSNNPNLDNVNYTDNLTPVEGPNYVTEFNRFFRGSGGIYYNTSWSIFGYFLAPTTGSYTFFTNSDDASYLWIGNNALQGYTRTNALVNNGGIHPPQERSGSINLTAGIYYPFRVIYGNQNISSISNPTELTISFSGPGIAKRTDGTGYFFSRNVTVPQPITRTINGRDGEMVFRGYRIIASSSYTSTDGFDGVLFYGETSPQPFGYVRFTSNTTYTITRSTTEPRTWQPGPSQFHDTLTLARETRGGLFKINSVTKFSSGSRAAVFAECLAEFIADTI